MAPVKLREGDKVEAKCKGSTKHYPGVIFLDNLDGTLPDLFHNPPTLLATRMDLEAFGDGHLIKFHQGLLEKFVKGLQEVKYGPL